MKAATTPGLRTATTVCTTELAAADFIIEAVTENSRSKPRSSGRSSRTAGRDDFRLEHIVHFHHPPGGRHRAARFIGLHFFNPVPVMKLVEVVPGLQTSPETVEQAMALATSAGKTPVRVNDSPGFISNRLLMPMINEAVYCLMEGVADAKGIDDVMKLGMNHPMGPLELADLIGLDVCLDIMKVLYESFRDSKYRPCPLLEKMVTAGWLGRKTGAGVLCSIPGSRRKAESRRRKAVTGPRLGCSGEDRSLNFVHAVLIIQ